MNRSRQHARSSPLLAIAWLLATAVQAQEASRPGALTLAEARLSALERNPSLQSARAALAGARAQLRAAGLYPFNPVLEAGAARRDGGGRATTDREISLSQEVEIGGQRGKRRAAARADLAAAQASFLHAGRLVAAQVEHVYAEAVKGRELLKIETVDVELARTYRDYARMRHDAGAGTQIEENLALATLGRAERRLHAQEAAYQESRSLLAETIGLGLETLPEPSGSFPGQLPEPPGIAALLETAARNRADLVALEQALAAARARVRLARSGALPNLTLAAYHAREADSERLLGGRVTIGIPVFNRNQGEIALRQAEARRAGAEQAGLELQARREVRSAYFNLVAVQATLESLRTHVLGTLEENLDLLRRSFTAGKIGATELLVFRREFIESQREYVEAQAFAWQMQVALDLAAGRLSAIDLPGEENQP